MGGKKGKKETYNIGIPLSAPSSQFISHPLLLGGSASDSSERVS